MAPLRLVFSSEAPQADLQDFNSARRVLLCHPIATPDLAQQALVIKILLQTQAQASNLDRVLEVHRQHLQALPFSAALHLNRQAGDLPLPASSLARLGQAQHLAAPWGLTVLKEDFPLVQALEVVLTQLQLVLVQATLLLRYLLVRLAEAQAAMPHRIHQLTQWLGLQACLVVHLPIQVP